MSALFGSSRIVEASWVIHQKQLLHLPTFSIPSAKRSRSLAAEVLRRHGRDLAGQSVGAALRRGRGRADLRDRPGGGGATGEEEGVSLGSWMLGMRWFGGRCE